MDHSTSSFVARGGVTIFTQTWRPAGEARSRIVLLHGYGEHSGRYGHVAEALTADGHVVAAMDLRGHGRSGGPRGLVRDFEVMATDVDLFREELSRDADAELPQVLLGHSFGGATAIQHLLGDHDELAAVVLSAPYVRNAASVALPLKLLAPILGKLIPSLPTQAVPPDAVSRDPAVVAAYAEDPLVFHGAIPAATGAQLLGLENRLLPMVGAITEPVLILHGTEDQLAAVSGSRDIAARIGDHATLKTYDGLHHEVFNEPEQKDVLADVIEWLDAQL